MNVPGGQVSWQNTANARINTRKSTVYSHVEILSKSPQRPIDRLLERPNLQITEYRLGYWSSSLCFRSVHKQKEGAIGICVIGHGENHCAINIKSKERPVCYNPK